jgi:homoserine acetyltransferase
MIKRLNNLLQRLPVQVPVHQMKSINDLLDDCQKLYDVLESKTGLDNFLMEQRFKQQEELEGSIEKDD